MDKVARKVMKILNIEENANVATLEDDSSTMMLELLADDDSDKFSVMTAVHILCERDSENIDKYSHKFVI